MLKALKENLSLLTLLVVLIGTSSTDAYYSTFGLKYQLLNMPASHIFFRGLTAAYATPILCILYLIALAVVAGQSRLATLLGGLDRLRWANHVAIAIFILLGWLAGERAGYLAAINDMKADATTLPLVARIDLKEGSAEQVPSSASQGYRLLLQTSDGLRFFKTVANPATDSPLVKFLPAESIHALAICARC